MLKKAGRRDRQSDEWSCISAHQRRAKRGDGGIKTWVESVHTEREGREIWDGPERKQEAGRKRQTLHLMKVKWKHNVGVMQINEWRETEGASTPGGGRKQK